MKTCSFSFIFKLFKILILKFILLQHLICFFEIIFFLLQHFLIILLQHLKFKFLNIIILLQSFYYKHLG